MRQLLLFVLSMAMTYFSGVVMFYHNLATREILQRTTLPRKFYSLPTEKELQKSNICFRLQKVSKNFKECLPGDSLWPFYPLVEGHLTFEKVTFSPSQRKVTLNHLVQVGGECSKVDGTHHTFITLQRCSEEKMRSWLGYFVGYWHTFSWLEIALVYILYIWTSGKLIPKRVPQTSNAIYRCSLNPKSTQVLGTNHVVDITHLNTPGVTNLHPTKTWKKNTQSCFFHTFNKRPFHVWKLHILHWCVVFFRLFRDLGAKKTQGFIQRNVATYRTSASEVWVYTAVIFG